MAPHHQYQLNLPPHAIFKVVHNKDAKEGLNLPEEHVGKKKKKGRMKEKESQLEILTNLHGESPFVSHSS